MSLRGMVGRWLGAGPGVDRTLRQAIEHAVDTVDPLLRTVSGYERRLAGGVAGALAYGQQLAGKVPGPLAVDRGAFAADETIHAVFAAPDAIGEMLGRSRALRDFLGSSGSGAGDRLFALLGVRRREKAVSGIVASAGVIRRDVPQRLLYFADHTLGELACSEAEARRLLQAATLDSLARGFAACVAELRQQRLDMRTALQVERARNGRSERHQELEARRREAVASLAPQRLLDAFVAWLATGYAYLPASDACQR